MWSDGGASLRCRRSWGAFVAAGAAARAGLSLVPVRRHAKPEALRGVYFTSGAQSGCELPADGRTLLQRMRRRLAQAQEREQGMPASDRLEEQENTVATHGRQGFFIHDVLARVIVPEAHLVRRICGGNSVIGCCGPWAMRWSSCSSSGWLAP
ncbi:type VI secretion protein IcmF/TssM N-terminal domain-containing protein [Variovorax sp. UC122_21]|uniref:type VI secretion protein IcmF/TssM N-terminal domain-containing protein n=1 Tax=Variovorax sp. UC122_21 TaxID=3374554 RepID=UPI0037572E13